MSIQVFEDGKLVYTSGGAAVVADDWRSETGFPKLKTYDGVLVNVTSPVNPLWVPSVIAHVLGAQGAHVVEPSAGRSPAGFPADFGRVYFYDGVYADDAAVFEAIAQYAAQQAAVGQTPADPIPYTGSVNPDPLGAGDWAFELAHNLRSREHEIFTHKPRRLVNGPGTADMQQGDYATVGDVDSWYIPNGGALARFI